MRAEGAAPEAALPGTTDAQLRRPGIPEEQALQEIVRRALGRMGC